MRGDPDHPANFGRLCSKGSALADVLIDEGRLLYPEIEGKRASWDRALDLVARRFSETIAAHGPDSVAFYVSGQMLTEDYYVANKLMKGFIGSANIDTNSRLCMASAVAGHRRAFGADTVPCSYEDLEEADLVVLVGSNLAWCHPVLFQRLVAAKEKRGTTIVVDRPAPHRDGGERRPPSRARARVRRGAVQRAAAPSLGVGRRRPRLRQRPHVRARRGAQGGRGDVDRRRRGGDRSRRGGARRASTSFSPGPDGW